MQKLHNTIICGDCITVLNGVTEPFADLVFADPPFNIGYPYDKYHDKVETNNYLAWTRDWMAACVHVLKPHGSFYIAIGDDYAAHVRIIGDQLGLHCRNWIIWHYTFGQQTKNKFARSHTHILYFVNDPKNFIFNDLAVRLPSDRQLIYNDRRSNAAGKIPNDVWDSYSRVCGTFRERQGWHPCQMPELLLGRIIAASSRTGDLVLDPFNGSGTTAAAAFQLGRQYCGIDISEDYVQKTCRRLADIEKTEHSYQNGQLSTTEFFEFKRLFAEMGIAAETLIHNSKMLTLFMNQLRLRLNSPTMYDVQLIKEALKDLSTWASKK
ncbi:MAG TPA: DNA methyltransferase [Anaerohalosphaeraceae bacterium]|nr:site-specific DNA-methyltransferase [Phycisphaerae bacterium]HOK95830.1 DNA methyltransferase [Anaerohalosphaeraceae bacterium]HOL31819.1 DNA methyltransferase [Anaerohalosphaeraceae bacterium]HOM75487.1 DNA methyltransferase [Anaerohalosphaeraceae bacterium]HPC63785.1 DNA methyltransferase [Anaerohalosphaeraceae bacterium]